MKGIATTSAEAIRDTIAEDRKPPAVVIVIIIDDLESGGVVVSAGCAATNASDHATSVGLMYQRAIDSCAAQNRGIDITKHAEEAAAGKKSGN